ncbi:MAG: UvrD-helicase domain-containing protein [Bacteroidales bacterium]|nr:UvrD-helicase domain-containing protein [Bacteroidales bacterium]
MAFHFVLITITSTAAVVIAVCLIIAGIFLARYIVMRIGEDTFNQLVAGLKRKITPAFNEIQTIIQPTRLVSDEEVAAMSKKYNPLLVEIYKLEKHRYFDERVFQESGINSFKSLLKNIKQRKEENNQIYNAIADLKPVAASMAMKSQSLLHPSHYFTYSEYEEFLVSYQSIKPKIDKVFPKYSKFVSDDETKKLPALVRDLKGERSKHNNQFIQQEIEDNKSYFDTVLGSYPLDAQQRDSIVKLEDNCLVIASAGSGKTSTIVGKAKYLVEKQNIDPEKIILLTYTKKAAFELSERIKIPNLSTGTFHSLAYHIIAEVTGQAPSICSNDVPLNVFRKLIQGNHDFLHAVNDYLINKQSLMKLEHDYTDSFSYFEDRKKYGIQAIFSDMDDKIIFTRSEEEKRICSILTQLGIQFRYEASYIIDTRTPERRQYKPDFTIYFKDKRGQQQCIYLEHFAIDRNGQTPRWFGEGTNGGWSAANQRYLEGIRWKRRTHREYGTVLIETTSANFHDGSIEQVLVNQLIVNGVPINHRSDKELYDLMIQRNRQLEKTVFTLLLSFITLMKANEKTIDGLLDTLNNAEALSSENDARNRFILKEVVKPFFEAYQSELDSKYEMDFTDAIIQATTLCREGLWKQYDYILVDEFQDISVDRYKFLQALRSEKPKTKLYCVGDDWQSIFRFAGSDMSLFYDFENYFGYTELCKIETTYRFHQPLIDKSSAFIMKNSAQKRKTIKTPAGDRKKTYLNFVKCESDDGGVLNRVEEIVNDIPINESILIIGRYNHDAKSVGFNGKIDMKDNRIKVTISGREIFFLSVHSAKGLEADHVILVNCNQGAYGFPSLIEDDPILDFVLSKSDQYPFAEERRLFYVAMTRAKKKMYVLYDRRRPSPFISEFMLKLEIGSYLCPKCLEGKMIPIKEGTTSNGSSYRSFICSNNEAGCDFFETRYGNLTPPGTRITEDMTAQDVERLREIRRKARRVAGVR